MANNTTNGKAFEYACLKATYDKLIAEGKTAVIQNNKAYKTAYGKFDSLSVKEQDRYMDAAKTAVKMLFPLEPNLVNGSGDLFLSINSDAVAQGANGDVRDVMYIRNVSEKETWEIGLSCKHNHAALRHPRITESKDFGESWVGIHNSKEFIEEISKTIDIIASYEEKNITWNDIAPTQKDKREKYYVPILEAYKNEIARMCKANPDVPQKLLSYFFGSNDFYKVIMNESKKTTIIEAFNIKKTLGRKAGTIKPSAVVSVLSMPTRLIEVDFKRNKKGKASDSTIILVFDYGWTISMRLHNKDEKVRATSLAWDVQLVGLPTGIYVNKHGWYE